MAVAQGTVTWRVQVVHQGVVRHGVLCWMVDLYYMSDVEYYTSESVAWTQVGLNSA